MRLILFTLLIASAQAVGLAVEAGPARLGQPGKAEAANPELKTKVRALLGEALKANDVWTALQLEAYGQRIGLHPSPILGASEIIGEPLLAYPSQIVAMWDRGDSELVVSGGRAYQVASDGRPLALAIPLGGMVNAAGLSADGKVIAGVEMRRKAVPSVMAVETHALSSGSALLRTTLPYTAGDYEAGQVCVADDGSAVLFTIFDANDASPRLVIARTGDANLVVPGLWQPVGVGSGGTWALAHPFALRSADYPPVALLIANSPPRLLTAAAAGPGIALAVIAKVRPLPPAAAPVPAATAAPAPAAAAPAPAAHAAVAGDKTQGATAEKPAAPPAPVHLLHLIKASGEVVEVPQPMGFSKSCRLMSAGRWVVVSSGSGAKTPMTLDLLGNVATTGDEEQPEMTAIYRWSDLVGDPAAQPVFQVNSEWVVASNDVNALYSYHDKSISVLDLSGSEVVERPFAQVGFAIGAVRCEADMVKVSEEDGPNHAVFDGAGRLLWAGAAKSCDLFAPAWAVIESSGYQLIALNEDSGKRNVCKLQLEGGGWDIFVDRYGRRLVATKTKQWVECDLATGKLRHSGATAAPQATVREQQPVGRFRLEHARLIEKGVPVGSEEPSAGWAPLDAWRDGPTLLVLDRSERIFCPAKRRGFSLLGWCDDASYFSLYKGALALANDNDKVTAGFGTGPVLVVDFTGKGMAAAEPLPIGPWHVQGLTFQIPHGGLMAWDASKAGFMARQLHSPPAEAGLLVVTDSLIFDLEAGIARQMGSPEKAAP